MASKALKRKLKWLCIVTSGALLALAFSLWLILLSPFGYTPAEQSLVLEEDQHHGLFVYGTLRNPLIRLLVTGSPIESSDARIHGFRREGLNLVAEEGASVDGELLWVNTRQMQRLDRYERLGVRYERVLIPLDPRELQWTLPPETSPPEQVWVYQRL